MPGRDWTLRVRDILDALAKIERYTAGLTRESFSADEKTVDAVLRNLTVIGEAAKHIPAEVEAKHPELPWAEMRGIRNVVVHEYFGVSTDILWETATNDLPSLANPLRQLLEEGPKPP